MVVSLYLKISVATLSPECPLPTQKFRQMAIKDDDLIMAHELWT